MPISKSPHTKRIVEDALTIAKQADDEHVKKPVIATIEQATQRMKDVFEIELRAQTAALKAARPGCYCKSSRKRNSDRSSSSSSRERATRASARATSRPCSSRSSATRSSAAR